jgi:adenosine deaminase
MGINPDLFPVEDLVLDRLYANQIESEDTVELVRGVLTQDDLHEEERARYEARLAEEEDKVDLLKELISRKRLAVLNNGS